MNFDTSLAIPKILTKFFRRPIKYFEYLCYLSDANSLNLKHYFFNFFDVIVIYKGGRMTRMRQDFDGFATFTELFVLLKYLYCRDAIAV